MIVTKASGERVEFNARKLVSSLKRAGANNQIIDNIIKIVTKQLYDGMSTRIIYRNSFELLKKYSKSLAAKYKLKKSLFELGPTGYPFEKFVAELLKARGYKVQVGQVLSGNCVTHEVDVIAEKDNQYIAIECKFRSSITNKIDVKIPLYFKARYDDLKSKWNTQPGMKSKRIAGWIVTNNRFTTDAIKYGKCIGLNLVSWDYPENNSLKGMIDNTGLYPITCLTGVNKRVKQFLLDDGIVVCKALKDKPEILLNLGMTTSQVKAAMKEMNELC